MFVKADRGISSSSLKANRIGSISFRSSHFDEKSIFRKCGEYSWAEHILRILHVFERFHWKTLIIVRIQVVSDFNFSRKH